MRISNFFEITSSHGAFSDHLLEECGLPDGHFSAQLTEVAEFSSSASPLAGTSN